MQRKMQRKWKRRWQRLAKTILSLLAAGLLVISAYNPAYANPAGGTVVSGSAVITDNGNTTTINQTSNKAIINWQSFSIGKDEIVNFLQPLASSVALNRVVGSDPSAVYGTLNANGKVFLINPNGILFAPGSQVNVGGLVASTLNLSDNDFLNGNTVFEKNGSAQAVVNQGNITATDHLALLGPQVKNEGIIAARVTGLAAGNKVSLDFNGDKLLNVTVDTGAAGGSVTNRGTITATGGLVVMSAGTKDKLLNTVVNNSGVIRAQRVNNVNGVIRLEGGNAINSGTLDASGKAAGQAGGIVKVLGDTVTLASGSSIDVSGDAGGGTALIGGTYQGGSSEYAATNNTVQNGATINADAITSGNGGQVVVWANDATNFAGTITAKGGAVSGDGGSIETSGHALTVSGVVNAGAANGKNGSWLLDPEDLTVDATAASTISSALNSNTNVTLQTTSTTASGTGTITGGNGDITVNAPITWATGTGTLTLSAYNNINLNSSITAANGGLTLAANTSGTGNGATTGIITPAAGSSINVGTFTLQSGTWREITGSLSTFYAKDFRITGGTFLRAKGGDGVSGNPYQIADVYGLQGIGSAGMLGKYYSLANNIAASGTQYWNSGAGFVPIGYDSGNDSTFFTGSLDGGYTITGLTINRPGTDFIGLFGLSRGAISNVGLIGNSIVGRAIVGGLVGGSDGTTITNCYNTGTVTGSDYSIGGLVGYSFSGTITNSYSTGSVTGKDEVGGLVGLNFGTITNSYSTGTVTGNMEVGGLVGWNQHGTITNCYWDVNTSGKTTGIGGGTTTGATGLTTADWLTNGPIAKGLWDTTNTWVAGYPYPVLKSLPYVKVYAIATQVYGETTPTFNAVYANDQNGDMAGHLVNTISTNWLTNANSTSSAGPGYVIGATGGSVSAGYQLVYNGTLTITPRNITVTANNTSKVYGDANPTSGAVTLSAGSLVGSDTLGSANLSSTATTTSSVGDYTLTPNGVSFTSGSASNYNITYANGTLTITPRNITVTANNTSKVYGDADPTSGAVTLSAGSLVGSDTLGSANLSSTATTTSSVGDYTLTPNGVSFTSGSASNYNITYANGTLTITPRNITVTANASKVYGDVNPASGAVTLSAGSLVGSDAFGSANLSSTATTTSSVGDYTLTPSGVSFASGNASNYNISYVNGTLTITPRNITVTANNTSKIYGDANPTSGAVTLSAGSLVNGDTLSSASLSSTATTTSSVGDYTLTPSGVSFSSGSASNYNISYVNGTLTITPRNITVTANNTSKVYGDANPTSGAVTLSAGSLVGSDTLGSANLSSTATTTSSVGDYTLTPSGVSFASGNASNYNISYVNGTLTITPRNITVTASASKVYGDANPASGAVTLTAGSLVGSDTLGSANLSSTATINSSVGDYTLTPSGVSFSSGSASNYNVSYVNGTLRVSPACLTITANNATKYSGQTNPAFTATFSGLANGDSPASLSGDLNFITAATTSSGPGTYTITLTGTLTSPNYIISYGNGTLTVSGRAADPAYDGAVIHAEQLHRANRLSACWSPLSSYMAGIIDTYLPLAIRGSGINTDSYVPWNGLDNLGQTDN